MKTIKILNLVMLTGMVFFLGSCKSTKNTPSPPAQKKEVYKKIPATKAGLKKGFVLAGKEHYIEKDEFDGSKMQFTGNFTIIPKAKVFTSSEHERGAIKRTDSIVGKDIVKFGSKPIFLVKDSEYESKFYPNKFTAFVKVKKDEYCLPMILDNNNYIVDLDYSIKKVKAFKTKKIKVQKTVVQNGKEKKVFRRVNGKLVPVYVYKTKKVPVIKTKKVFITSPTAGWRYTSPCDNEHYYIDEKDVEAVWSWIRHNVVDKRKVVRTDGYGDPNANSE